MTRRGSRELLPAFAHWFHIMPWDFERLTFAEIQVFAEWLPKKDDDEFD